MTSLGLAFDGAADGPRTTEEFVAASVRNAILSGRLPVGTRIVQSEVAKRLGVSITPVREALRLLSAERLLDLDPHRGAVVRGLSLQDVRDLNFLRVAIEPEVMRRAVANISDEDIDEAERIQAELREEADPERWTALNREFHRVFLRAARSELLVDILTGLQNSYASYIAARMMAEPEGMAQAGDDHDRILEAIRLRDTDAAIHWTISHMRFAVNFMENADAPSDGDD